jgi:hypothetical protein
VLDGAVAQQLQNRVLRCLGLALESLVYESSLFSLGWEVRGRTYVCLIGKHNEKFSLLTVSSVFHYPRRNLVRSSESVPWRIGLDCQCPWLR